MNITCSALPETLLESELFGHERGAFTGADRQKRGLDRIGRRRHGVPRRDRRDGAAAAGEAAALPRGEGVQAGRRLGGHQGRRPRRSRRPIDRSRKRSRRGASAKTCIYRLNVMAVPLPPLRDRRDDIPLLINHYIDAFNIEFRKKIRGVVAGGDGRRCSAYPWPGNVRELRNAVERAMLLAESARAQRNALPGAVGGRAATLSTGMSLPAERHQPRGARTIAGRPGARAQRAGTRPRRRRCSA